MDYKLLDHLTVRDNMILPLMLEHKDVEAAVRKVEERPAVFHRIPFVQIADTEQFSLCRRPACFVFYFVF